MIDTRSNMQLYDLNSKPHGGKSLRDLIDPAIGVHFVYLTAMVSPTKQKIPAVNPNKR